MLESLHVRNYVLIDKLDLDFSEGFSCITGETGSGKSIILGALSLLLGAKADKDAVRKGEKSAEISAVFTTESKDALAWLEEHAIEYDDQILIRRIIKETGRSSYSVNSVMITRQEGEELGRLLVDLSGQHAYQALLKYENLRTFLDDASSSEKYLLSYSNTYSEYKKKQNELNELKDSVNKNAEEADYMRYCLNELENANLEEGEEENLKAEIQRISSSEFLSENISEACEELKSAISSLSQALAAVKKAERKDPILIDSSSEMESRLIESEDLLETLRDYKNSISYSEYELEEKNERLSVIQKVKRRFGGSVEEAIRKREEYREKLERCENSEELIAKLEKQIAKLYEELSKDSERLTEVRVKGAEKLEKKIESNLHLLGMKSAKLKIAVTESDDFTPYGKDRISFLIAANKGEKFSELENSSSGGELSRIMLALKVSMNKKGNVETMLFDEIDSGIGGVIANNVATLLKTLSENYQVFAITHLSQLAVKADHHYLVYKKEVEGRTLSRIKNIDGDERVKEIARLLSGETSEISLEHAKALLEVQN